jgi:hypothetical protein
MMTPSRSRALRVAACCMLFLAFAGQTGAQAPSDANLAAAKDLVDAIGIENIMTTHAHGQMKTFMVPLQQANRGREKEVFEVFRAVVMPYALQAYTAEPVRDEIAKFYAQRFSASEMKDMIAFFSTPAGRKFASSNTDLNDGLPLLAVRLTGTMTVNIALKAGLDEIQKRGMTIPTPATK